MILSLNSAKRYFLFILLFGGLMFMRAPRTHAQIEDVGDILRAGADDSVILLEKYLEPFGHGFGAGLNSGWINSARPYRTLGFDVRVNMAVAVVPKTDRSFDVTQLSLQNLEKIEGPDKTPTAFGNDSDGPVMGIFATNPYNSNEREKVAEFTMPPVSGIPMFLHRCSRYRPVWSGIRMLPCVICQRLRSMIFRPECSVLAQNTD